MEKIELTFLGEDDFSRPVYKTKDGKIFKDLNLGMGEWDLCTASSFDAEPVTPIRYIDKYKNCEFVVKK